MALCLESSKENQPNSPVFRKTRDGGILTPKVPKAGTKPKCAHQHRALSPLRNVRQKRSRTEAEGSGPEVFDPVKRQKRAKNTFAQYIKNKLSSRDQKVFKNNLDVVISNQKSRGIESDIPEVVSWCIDFLIPRHLDEVGLFRVNASNSVVAKLRKDFNTGKKVDYGNEKISPHVVSALLKMYIRELPCPLVPIPLQTQLLAIFDLEEDYTITNPTTRAMSLQQTKVQTIYQTFTQLTPNNLKLMITIFNMLHKVSLRADANKMTSRNLSIVWGPNLFWSGEIDFTNPNDKRVSQLKFVNMLVEFVIDHYQGVFSRLDVNEKTPKLEFVSSPRALRTDVLCETPKSKSTTKKKRPESVLLRKPSLPNVRPMFDTPIPKLSMYRDRSQTIIVPDQSNPGLLDTDPDALDNTLPLEFVQKVGFQTPRKKPISILLYYYRLSDSKRTLFLRLNKILDSAGIVPMEIREDDTQAIDPSEALKIVRSCKYLTVYKNNELHQPCPQSTPDYELYEMIIDSKTKRLATPTIVLQDRIMIGFHKAVWSYILLSSRCPKE